MLTSSVQLALLGLILSAAVAAPGVPPNILLELLILRGWSFCLEEDLLFDSTETVSKTIEYAASGLVAILPANRIAAVFRYVAGCNLRQSNRGFFIVKALKDMTYVANTTTSFTVFIGPPLGGDCKFASDWIAQGPNLTSAIHHIYQVGYICLLESFMRGIMNEDEDPDLGSMPLKSSPSASMTVLPSTVIKALEILLRYQGWRRIRILYEVNQMASQLYWLANNIRVVFTETNTVTNGLNVISFEGFLIDLNFTTVFEAWNDEVDGKCNKLVHQPHQELRKVKLHAEASG